MIQISVSGIAQLQCTEANIIKELHYQYSKFHLNFQLIDELKGWHYKVQRRYRRPKDIKVIGKESINIYILSYILPWVRDN